MENNQENNLQIVLPAQNSLYNVALFIDYENVYKNLLEEERNVIRDGFFEKIREWCRKNKRRLVKIAVYCNYDNEDLHNSYHQSLLQSYGVESIHTSNQGKNFADLQITIDVLTAMHLNDNIDEFMIMSNDKDMTPLLNNIRYNKRKVSVITVGDKYNDAICSFSDEQIKYEDIFKEHVEHSYIKTLEEKINRNLYTLFNKNKSNHMAAPTNPFSHIKLEFFAKNQMKQCCLMLYEVYNCIRILAEDGKLAFYKYIYDNKQHIGICPTEEKGYLKEHQNIKDEDFSCIDMEQYVKNSYCQKKKPTEKNSPNLKG